jgi:single-strand DNA-binding protein
VYVDGRIEYRQWQDKENQTRYSTEINVRELIMLSGRSGGQDMEGGVAAGARTSAPRNARTGSGGGNDFDDFHGTMEDEDDDLPF